MFKKNTTIKNALIKSISINKNRLTVPIAFLMLILVGYLIFHNTSSKKVIEDNSNNLNILESENTSPTQDVSSFHKADSKTTLINDNRGIPVLYYHSVRESADNEVTITPELLKTELKYISDEGYVTLTLSELKAYI